MTNFHCLMLVLASLIFFQCTSTDLTKDLEYSSSSILTLSSDSSHLALPYLFTHEDGKTYLSFVERNDSLTYLKYSTWDGEKWSMPNTIASGNTWFVNWADYPQLSVFSDGTLMACFLDKNGEGKFAYEIKYTLSKNGVDWSEPKVLHQDGTETEHGFFSMKPWKDQMFISWLDGRNTGKGHDDSHAAHDHGHHGNMNLRGAIINSDGSIAEDILMDDRVCDCCQTTAIISPNGPTVFYRDRSESEVRDIAMVNWNAGKGEKYGPIYNDNWEVSGCPVNGPRADSWKETVAVAWFTGSNSLPEVKVVFSNNSGKSFQKPIRIDNGNTHGRVDIALLDTKHAWVSWMENDKIFSRIVSSEGKSGRVIPIGSSSDKRSSGFPQMTVYLNEAHFAWTDDTSERSVIHTKIIQLKK